MSDNHTVEQAESDGTLNSETSSMLVNFDEDLDSLDSIEEPSEAEKEVLCFRFLFFIDFKN